MLVLEAEKIRKAYGDRLLFEIDKLEIYLGDRIGVVGINGSGKTTLLNILTGIDKDYEGWVKIHGEYSYITQLGDIDHHKKPFTPLAKRLGVEKVFHRAMSGGEKTRIKIAQALGKNCNILFADEPTCNLDIEGILQLEKELQNFPGAIVIISHDREMLDKLCMKIWEIDQGEILEYPGNYSEYKEQKAKAIARQWEEYEKYTREKKRLKKAIQSRKQRAASMSRPPSRMGNSEARLHKQKARSQRAKVERAAKMLEKRLDQLEIKEKPKTSSEIKIDLPDSSRISSDVVISVRELSKAFGDKSLFQKVSFDIHNGSKIALVGENGCGKTTLMKMILQQEAGVYISPQAKIGYLSQDFSTLDEEKTVLENALAVSIHPASKVRLILARLLFKKEDVHKKVSMLSGGERIKASFAKIILSDANIIFLDEPTNYLDVNSQEALEEVLVGYGGTLFFISHDRRFVDRVAERLLVMKDQEVKEFFGTYSEYLNDGFPQTPHEKEKKILELENKLAEVLGKLSIATQKDDIHSLDQEYNSILNMLKKLKPNF